MPLSRKWIAECDAVGCDARLIITPDEGPVEKADAGMYVNDQGWSAAPGRVATFCPDHFPDTEKS